MENNKQTLLIGKPATSKTTFLVQLYSLMRSGNSKMKLESLPASIKPIEDAYKRLRRGDEPQPTPADTNTNLVLDIRFNEQKFKLTCPDYGGEQVNSLIQNRAIKDEWLKMIEDSNEWLLFIKLHDVTQIHDVTTKSAKEVISTEEKEADSEIGFELPEAIELIELIQMMLYFKQVGYHKPINDINLKVVVTRWDEVNSDSEIPMIVLKQKLPLLHEYLVSNWVPQKISIWGLSAQGFELKSNENKEKYLEEGNEKWAYLLRPDGIRSSDITELLSTT